MYLGNLAQELENLNELYGQLRGQESNYEMREGMLVVEDITRAMQSALRPVMVKFNVRKLPAHQLMDLPTDLLGVLQMIYSQLAKVEILLIVFMPTAGALWDKEFIEVVDFSTKQLNRQLAWAKQMLSVKAPQSLIVPKH